MARHEPDKSSKWLIQHHGGSILRIAGATGIRHWKAMQAEIVQPRKLPDGLLEVYFEGQRKPDYVLLEMATHPEKRVPKQVSDDLGLAEQQLGVLPEVLTVVLAPKGQFRVTGRHETQSRLGWSKRTIEWRVVELWTLTAEALLATGDVGVIPWVPLTQFDGPPEELFVRCRQRIERQAPVTQHANLLAVAHVLAGLRYTDPKLLSLLGGRERMSEFPAIKQIISETKQETKHEAILEVLTTRFGDVPDQLSAGLERIGSNKRLTELLRFAVICPDLAAFQQRLKM